ncbi:DMT family transporter [Palleronia sp.]|uniref:DMT family transporter n=1 Tax=Palleronia sp. TaxID=1940284 RepID=UPI0035C81832
MTTDSTIPQGDDNLRATGFMVLSMAFFATEDFFIKRVTAEMPVSQMLFLICSTTAAILALLCLRKGLPLVTRDVLGPQVMGRNFCEAFATISFVTALSLVPLTLATAIQQATPLLVTAGAAIWLGETVGWRRWTAVAIGMAGVLLILRPGLEGFQPEALLVIVAAIGLAARDVISRRIPSRIATLQLAFWAYVALTIGTGLLWMIRSATTMPGLATWLYLGAATALGVIGYLSLTTATRLGHVSTVIPFRYTRLVFALILGMVFLGERPDALTLVGAAIVVGSGLYALMRERRRKRAEGRPMRPRGRSLMR